MNRLLLTSLLTVAPGCIFASGADQVAIHFSDHSETVVGCDAVLGPLSYLDGPGGLYTLSADCGGQYQEPAAFVRGNQTVQLSALSPAFEQFSESADCQIQNIAAGAWTVYSVSCEAPGDAVYAGGFDW